MGTRHEITSLGRCSCGWVFPVSQVQGITPMSGVLTVIAGTSAHVLASALFAPFEVQK